MRAHCTYIMLHTSYAHCTSLDQHFFNTLKQALGSKLLQAAHKGSIITETSRLVIYLSPWKNELHTATLTHVQGTSPAQHHGGTCSSINPNTPPCQTPYAPCWHTPQHQFSHPTLPNTLCTLLAHTPTSIQPPHHA